MRAEIVAIGDEVLSGWTVNGNAATIARQLYLAGIATVRHCVVSDDPEAMKGAVSEALQRSDLVICTGGLGPTLDDRTREALLEVVGGGMRFDEEVAADLRSRFGDDLRSLEDQASVPERAQALLNPVGTAPGLLFDLSGKLLILLPGVPLEMEALLEGQILPELIARFPSKERLYHESVQISLTRECDIDPTVRQLQADFPQLQFGVYPSQGYVAVRMGALDSSEEEAHREIAPARKRIEELYRDRLFEHRTLEESVHHRLIRRGETLATAESCTGGAIAARLTRLSGASNYFKGGVVAYSNEIKQSMLGVSEQTLANHGAVSEQTVREMVDGLLERFGTDYAVAVSGIAGPSGGTSDKPVGTVWLAIGYPGGCETYLLHLHGGRDAVIHRTVNGALARLLLHVH